MENNTQLKDTLIDLELAKNHDYQSPVRKYLPAMILAVSCYYSFLLSFGMVLGYLASKAYAWYFLEKGTVSMIHIEYGNWKIHLHHWILGGIALFLIWFTAIFHLSHFSIGFILGVMAHDIYDYNDWHKVLIRKEN